MKLLHVEDSAAARLYVARGLRRNGAVVESVQTIQEGFERAATGNYDALILDVVLPDGEGYELLTRLRNAGVETPAIYLSARREVGDRLRGFEAGGDDYLPKPFALAELLARARAIVRRKQAHLAQILRAADLEMDLRARSVQRAGRIIDLPPKQYALLEILMRNRGRVVRREEIVEWVWGPRSNPRPNVVNVQVSFLRKHVDHEACGVRLIHTVPCVGYVLRTSAAPPGRGLMDG